MPIVPARRGVGVFAGVVVGVALALTPSARQAAGAAEQSGQSGQAVETVVAEQARPPAPTPRAQRPEQVAYSGAMAMKDPRAKIEALQRVRTGFPNTPVVSSVNNALLTALIAEFPDRVDEAEIADAFDRVVKAIPPATASPETPLTLLQRPVTQLVDKKVALARAQAAVESAMASIDPERVFQAEADRARAMKQPEPTVSVALARLKSARGRGTELLGRIYAARDDPRAEATLKDALAANPSSSPVALLLAGLEVKRGDDDAALEHYLLASLGTTLKADDDATMRTLFRKVRGPEADLEDALDRVYLGALPNPVTPVRWTPGATRSDRMVLGEAFTGSACGPCVSESLAFQALLRRYPEEDVALLSYHVHIPGPDPMTTAASVARKNFYSVKGVPTVHVDGAMAKLGGGGRDMTLGVYNDYVKSIDAALDTPARAKLAVTATLRGDTIDVRASMSDIATDAKALTLHVVLAERTLRFSGENGIRFHEMVVRAMAGKGGGGLPIADDEHRPADLTKVYTFRIGDIRQDVSRSLEEEIARRRKTESASTNPRQYLAEGRAMVDLDRAQLVAIVFLQDSQLRILQTARADVK